jgi:hypothetical protein
MFNLLKYLGVLKTAEHVADFKTVNKTENKFSKKFQIKASENDFKRKS